MHDIAGLLAAHPSRIAGRRVRGALDERGIKYGPAFAGLATVHTAQETGSTVLAEIGLPSVIRKQQTNYGVHPALLDACFQSVAAHPSVANAGHGGLLLPLGVRRLRVYGPVPQRALLLRPGYRGRRHRASKPTSTCWTSTERLC